MNTPSALPTASPTGLLQTLQRWCDAGWLRALDLALARFLHELDDTTPDSLLLAAALLAHLEGRSHSCLPLADLVQDPKDPQTLLAWPPEAAEELSASLPILPGTPAAARAAWVGCSVLQIEPGDDSGSTPLVLSAGCLYLRRYWRYETEVAAQVRARAALDHDHGGAGLVDVDRARTLIQRLFATWPDQPVADPSADLAAKDGQPDWQQVACALALRSRLTLVTGGPGTGKTYTAARMLVLLQALHTGSQPLRVALAAPTGKAASRLRQSIEAAVQGLRVQLNTSFDEALPLDTWATALGPARTLHALLGSRPGTRRFRHDAAHPLELDLLFVDEASMVHLEMMAALLQALPPRTRVVLLGDKDQLASVEAGAVMGDLCLAANPAAGLHAYDESTVQWVRELTGQALQASSSPMPAVLAQQTVTLRRSRRFSGPIGQLALAVNRGDAAAAQTLLQASRTGPVAWLQARDPQAVCSLAVQGRDADPGLLAGGYAGYLQAMAQRPPTTAERAVFEAWVQGVLLRFDDFRVLCALREGPWGAAGLNTAISRALAERGLLSRRGEWYEGRPVMVTRNDAALGVFNGDIGVVLQTPGAGGGGVGGSTLRAWFLDGAGLRSVAVTRLADVETAFAMTVHKSQGSEFAHVALVLPEGDSAVLTRELVYTGITRARQALTLVAPDLSRLGAASGRLTRRLSGLADRLLATPPGPA